MVIHAEQLIGYTITDVFREKNGMQPDVFTFNMRNDKNETLAVYALADEEGNGPGALFANEQLVI